jgi:putative spermidine/putrescine transport system permease protein
MLLIFNLAMIGFMLLPIAIIVWMSFTPQAFFVLPFDAFSFRWYSAALEHDGFRNSFLLSFRLALVSATIAALLSFLAAYAITRLKAPGAKGLDSFFLSPLLIPHVVLGIALLQFVNSVGLYNNFWALAAAHVIVIVPFLMRLLIAAMADIPTEIEWAALNLGASRLRVMFGIILPICTPGLIAGYVFAFIISFDEIVVTIFMAGPSQQTLPVRMYGYLSDQFDPIVAAVSSLLILFAAAVVVLLERIGGLKMLTR